MTEIIFLFGGQSSRDENMINRLIAVDPEVGESVSKRVGELDFETNQGIQNSVFETTLGWLAILEKHGVRSTQSAGLSLGEYAHLVDIGAVNAEQCRTLVNARGKLYDHGPSGAMAAVYPSSWEDLEPIVATVPDVYPAVFNSPTQTVVGGAGDQIELLIDKADEELFTMSVVIEHRIPMHTPRFKPVASKLSEAIQETEIRDATKPYWSNVAGSVVDGSASNIGKMLTRHVYEPVRWRETIDNMVARFPDALFIEVGPKTVLRDLMKRRWHGDANVHAVDSDDPHSSLNAVLEEVSNVAR